MSSQDVLIFHRLRIVWFGLCKAMKLSGIKFLFDGLPNIQSELNWILNRLISEG